MQPETVSFDSRNYRAFDDGNEVKYSAAPIELFALRRIFALEKDQTKLVDFIDLDGFWKVESIYLSSPDTSEITLEILDSQNQVFFTYKIAKNQTPKIFPAVLVNSNIRVRLKAIKESVGVILIYLKPAHLLHSKDF